jgi:hypothetical protein
MGVPDPDPSFQIKAQTLKKRVQKGSHSIQFGLSSSNWCRSGSGSSLSLWCGSGWDPGPHFYLMRIRIRILIWCWCRYGYNAKMMWIHADTDPDPNPQHWVWELSRLCPETSTKLYVNEFGFFTGQPGSYYHVSKSTLEFSIQGGGLVW